MWIPRRHRDGSSTRGAGSGGGAVGACTTAPTEGDALATVNVAVLDTGVLTPSLTVTVAVTAPVAGFQMLRQADRRLISCAVGDFP